MALISIIIPTYNPNLDRLNQTLQGLRSQTLSVQDWELIIIDNNSTTNFEATIDLSWHPDAKVIREPQQGLTLARIKGFNTAKHDILIMVDDDNVLADDYLKQTVKIMNENPKLGAIGGKSFPLFEAKEPNYLQPFYGCLALRDLGEEIQIDKWNNSYPDFAPIGAGMAIRRSALKSYIKKIENGNNMISDRKGSSLSSGGDNDIIFEVLKSGFTVGYFPQLSLEHIIPSNRTSIAYLSKLNFESSVSWVRLLDSHNILPWKPINKKTLLLRYVKSYIKHNAWLNSSNYIKWRGSCGIFKALSEIN